VVAISASERTPNGTRLENFQEFQNFVASLGLGDAEILKPLGYWDVAFWDWMWSTKPRHVELERRIHDVLFPDAPFQYPAYERYAAYQGEKSDVAARKWLNKKCDVLGLWSHIHHGADLFVTSDENFHKVTKKPKLEAIGAKYILRPAEALALIRRGTFVDQSH
jgi:hypothetical protein